MDPITTLQTLEPSFIAAANLGLEMRECGVESHNKLSTGNPNVDIVTEADLAIQNLLLTTIGQTELINCRLLAEEDAAAWINKFNSQGEYYLAVDPIDNTRMYANGGKCFSTILSLHNGDNILYTFGYYPALEWGYKVVNNYFSSFGTPPNFDLPSDTHNNIVYWSGEPENNIPLNAQQDLQNSDKTFKKISTVSPDIDCIILQALDKVAGVYHQNMNVYDGITELAIALAKGHKVYSGGPNGKLDLRNIQRKESGLYYPGYYLTVEP